MKNKNIKLSAIGFLMVTIPLLSLAAETLDSDPTSPLIPGTMQVGGTINQSSQTNQTSGSVSAPTQTSGTSGSFSAPTKTPTSAKSGGTQVISLPNPLGSIKTIPELIGRLVDWLIYIASIAILPAMIIYAAYQFLTAGGNPDAVTSARHTLTWAVVGYALLLISKGIESIIRQILTGSF